MAKKGAREIVGMLCSECKNFNYVTMRNKINMELSSKGARLQLKKYCKHCKKKTLHKETTKLK
jgi:large subunit ribosomal protein L33